MDELAVLKNQNLVTLSTRKGLSKKESILFAKEITEVSCAKNIKLMEGTMEAWEKYLIQDLNNIIFTFEEFLLGLNELTRKPLFNRLDYADAYKEAIGISYMNINKKYVACPLCGVKIEFSVVGQRNHYSSINCSCELKDIWETEESRKCSTALFKLKRANERMY